MFEEYHDDINFYNNHFYILAFIQVMYLPTIYFIYNYMKDKQPLNCKTYMGIWNMMLAVFSMYCTRYITYPLLVNTNSLEVSVCTDTLAYNDLTLNKWRGFFVLSKFPEMIDTVWIAVRKRKLTVLQLWHHFSVCLYCWLIVTEKNSVNHTLAGGYGTYFAGMNSFVHSIMYSYYAIVSLSSFRSNMIAQCITFLQTSQMVLGIMILLYKTFNCVIMTNYYEVIFSYVMYGSYLYLFMMYYMNRYGRSLKKDHTKKLH